MKGLKTFKKIKHFCKIVNKEKVSSDFCSIEILSPFITQNSSPGQFINIRCNKEGLLLRRPFGISDVNLKKGTFKVLFKIVGDGTKWLCSNRGDDLDILGPLGNGFGYDSDIKNKLVYFVSGGTGIAPFPFLIKVLKDYTDKLVLFSGFKTKKECLNKKFFDKLNIKSFVATDDGSFGKKGFVSDILIKEIKNGKVPDKIYACGPNQMLKTVSLFSKKYRIDCQISLEEKMACGFGICMGCTVKTKSGNKLVCKDGPVFKAEEVF